ncbi:Tricarboxylate transport protein TctC [Burkholderiales bacterium 8X]|nr:Tricarboxylate transport protein TctC [Burkholderiales bacterium 8X]
MKPNKTLRWLAAASLAALVGSAPAMAQDYPNKPVKIVVGFAPGGANDIIARLIAQELGTAWGSAVVVENKPGANGAIAFQYVAKSAPDGYTLALGTAGPTTMNQALQKLPFDAIKDFTPIVNLVDAPHALAVNAKLPVNNMKEFVAYAKKANPTLSYSSPGIGNSGHFAMELLKQQTGMDITHVAYKGAAPALNDLIAGHVQAYFTSAAALLPHINTGTIKVLAITSDKRLPQLPNVPTMAEAGFADFEFPVYGGLLGPAGMPAEVVQKINRDSNKALQSPVFLKTLEQNAMVPLGGTPKDFAKFLGDDLQRWTKVVKAGNIKPE